MSAGADVVCPSCEAVIPLPRPNEPSAQAFLVSACNSGDDDLTFRQVAESVEHVAEIVRSVIDRWDYVHVDNLRALDARDDLVPEAEAA